MPKHKVPFCSEQDHQDAAAQTHMQCCDYSQHLKSVTVDHLHDSVRYLFIQRWGYSRSCRYFCDEILPLDIDISSSGA